MCDFVCYLKQKKSTNCVKEKKLKTKWNRLRRRHQRRQRRRHQKRMLAVKSVERNDNDDDDGDDIKCENFFYSTQRNILSVVRVFEFVCVCHLAWIAHFCCGYILCGVPEAKFIRTSVLCLIKCVWPIILIGYQKHRRNRADYIFFDTTYKFPTWVDFFYNFFSTNAGFVYKPAIIVEHIFIYYIYTHVTLPFRKRIFIDDEVKASIKYAFDKLINKMVILI